MKTINISSVFAFDDPGKTIRYALTPDAMDRLIKKVMSKSIGHFQYMEGTEIVNAFGTLSPAYMPDHTTTREDDTNTRSWYFDLTLKSWRSYLIRELVFIF